MTATNSLLDVGSWQRTLGLLAVPLYGRGPDEQEHVLLNGGKGNFCLGRDVSEERDRFRNVAWSSNVDFYIRLVDNKVDLYRWELASAPPESYPLRVVQDNLGRFHEYLGNKAAQTANSVVAHFARTYRSFRAAATQKADPSDVLDLFLTLLASVADETSPEQVNFARWGLSTGVQQKVGLLRSADWDAFREALMISRIGGMRMDIPLALRHAAGQLFQETHYEMARFEQLQMQLPGFIPAAPQLEETTPDVGVYFTPPALARALVEEAFHALGNLPREISIYDPSCGSGEFLREAIRQLELRQFIGTVRLIGRDISPAALSMTEFVLAWESRGKGFTITRDIQQSNALYGTTHWPANVDLVIMNPPFVSWRDLGREEQDAVVQLLGDRAKGRPDLASAFVWRATASLKEGGVLASVIPASLLDGESSRRLREDLQEQLDLSLLARLGSQYLFTRAIVDAGLLVGRKAREIPDHFLSVWANHKPVAVEGALRSLRRIRADDSSALPVDSADYSLYESVVVDIESPRWNVRSYSAYRLREALNTRLPKVKDLFDVRQGGIPGIKEVFVHPKEYVTNLKKAEQKYFRPALVGGTLHNGRLVDRYYAFYPHSSGLLPIADENDLKKRIPTFFEEVLRPNKRRLQDRARIKQDNWWVWSEQRAWQRSITPKLVTAYFGNKGAFAWDETGEYVVIQGYAWVPNASTQEQVEDGEGMPRSIALAYVALLSSDSAETLLSSVSNHLAGGQWNLSKRFINELPIPDLFSQQTDVGIVKELKEFGEAISCGKPIDREQLEELARLAYGF